MKTREIFEFQLYRVFYFKFIKKFGTILPYIGSKFILDKTAKIVCENRFYTNSNCKKRNGRSTIIRMDKNAHLNIMGNFSIFYGGDIVIFENGVLTLGSGFCNSDVKIRCMKSITVGSNVCISHDVTIMDSDAHHMHRNDYSMTRSVVIGDNVWIGTKAMILKGVKIGNGAVIAAGAVVTHDVPEYSLAAGVPARIIKRNIAWGND